MQVNTPTHQLRPQEMKKPTSETTCKQAYQTPTNANFTKYFVITPQEGHSLAHLKIFAISKFLQGRIGQVEDIKRLNNGSNHVEAASYPHAELLTHLDSFTDIPISSCPHRSLNSSRGVIQCRELRDCQEDEIVDDLRHQGVVAAKQLTSNRNVSVQ
jgi:hypothetical protein